MLRMYSGPLLYFHLVVTYSCALEVETNIFGTFKILIKARSTLLTIVGDLFVSGTTLCGPGLTGKVRQHFISIFINHGNYFTVLKKI